MLLIEHDSFRNFPYNTELGIIINVDFYHEEQWLTTLPYTIFKKLTIEELYRLIDIQYKSFDNYTKIISLDHIQFKIIYGVTGNPIYQCILLPVRVKYKS